MVHSKITQNLARWSISRVLTYVRPVVCLNQGSQLSWSHNITLRQVPKFNSFFFFFIIIIIIYYYHYYFILHKMFYQKHDYAIFLEKSALLVKCDT